MQESDYSVDRPGGRRDSMPKINRAGKAYLWFTDRLYNELAWAYDFISSVVSLGQWSIWRKQALAYITGKKILEIGFGTGELLIELKRRGFATYGLEVSSAMQQITAGKLGRLGLLCISRVCGKAQQLPFKSEYFDTVIVTFPAQYIFDPSTLAEIARVLRSPDEEGNIPPGRLVIVGLTISPEGKSLGGVDVKNIWDQQFIKALGWDIRVIRPSHRKFCLPVIILEKQD